eukprot:jgi/Ulvmu1/7604/UM038_0029.1
MPKKKSKGKKGGKPSWMSDELFALSQDPAGLLEAFRGTSDKGDKGDKTSPINVVTREQAGLLLWKLLYPSDKKTKAKRGEALKAEVLEISAKHLASADQVVATPAAGLLALFCQDAETERETILGCKPAVMTSTHKALMSPSVSLVAASCKLLCGLSCAPDSRPRVLRAVKDWDLRPLIDACVIRKFVGTHGSRGAGIDAMHALSCLVAASGTEAEPCTPQDADAAEAVQRSLLACGGLPALLSVARNNGPPLSAAYCACTVLHMFKTIGPEMSARFAEHGGVFVMVRILSNPYVSLEHRAAAAGNLWHFMVPNNRLASRRHGQSSPPQPDGNILAEDGHELLWEQAMLDEAERERVLENCRLVVQAGAITWLVQLCASADGPIEDRTHPDYVPPPPGKKKGKAKSKGKKKKGKLEPGMLDAQTYAAGCLRMLSLDEDNKTQIMSAGAPRYIAHLLDCKQDLPRWHARQTLLNLAMVPSYACVLALYDIPNFVTGGNIPNSSPCRPQTAPAALEGKSGAKGVAAPAPPVSVA